MGFFSSKTFVRHFFAALLIYSAIIWLILRLISNYTLHGKTIAVPDLKGKEMGVVEKLLNDVDLKFMVIDSVYVAEKPKGCVIEQNPAPGFQVKKSRTVYLTLNAFNPPKVKLPELKDVSLRQATAVLETYGLEVGNLSYVPDFAKDAVIEMKYKGRSIAPGTQVVQGQKIDLVLGDGLEGEKIDLPNFLGLSRKKVLEQIKEFKLSVGAEVFDTDVKDSSIAKVYRQIPPFRIGEQIVQGRPVDLFFTNDADKIKAAKDSVNFGDDEEE
jgi:eukaryotic-like serine/threonine-protein kinase